MHHWISGDEDHHECFACGVALDVPEEFFDKAAMLLPECLGPIPRSSHDNDPWLGQEHHYVYVGPLGGASVGVDGAYLDCAYGDSVIKETTEFASVSPSCVGG